MAGRYVIEDVLGDGSYATVCVARLVEGPADLQVALKVLKPQRSDDLAATDRFRDEARIMQALDHPHIVRGRRLLDYDGRLVLEMEYVHGITLEQLIHERGRLPWRAALGIGARVASALHAAHNGPFGPGGAAMRIVHRDLKPGNILISADADVKLMDFGVAKGDFEDRAAKSLHYVWGTLGYDAPERRHGVVTPAADVYALGVTLFVMLTGRPVVASQRADYHDAEIDRLLGHVEPEHLDDPGPLVTFLRRMLLHAHDLRPSMDEVQSGLTGLEASAGTDGPADLAAVAADVVGAALARLVPMGPATLAPFSTELSFLETTEPAPELPSLVPEQAERVVRELMAKADWASRLAEVKRVLERTDAVVDAPFVELLSRLDPPWWMFWNKAPEAVEAEAALLLLCDAPTPAAVRVAQRLVDHPDDRVANAAAFLLERSGVPG